MKTRFSRCAQLIAMDGMYAGFAGAKTGHGRMILNWHLLLLAIRCFGLTELALQGLQTSIQKVTINNKDAYHRVRVGPFRDLGTLDKTRQTLKKKGIDSTPIKVTG